MFNYNDDDNWMMLILILLLITLFSRFVFSQVGSFFIF